MGRGAGWVECLVDRFGMWYPWIDVGMEQKISLLLFTKFFEHSSFCVVRVNGRNDDENCASE